MELRIIVIFYSQDFEGLFLISILCFCLFCIKFNNDKVNQSLKFCSIAEPDTSGKDDGFRSKNSPLALPWVIADPGSQTQSSHLPSRNFYKTKEIKRQTLEESVTLKFKKRHLLTQEESNFALSLQQMKTRKVRKYLENMFAHKITSLRARTSQITWLIRPLPEISTTDGKTWNTCQPVNVLHLVKGNSIYNVHFVPNCNVKLESRSEFTAVTHLKMILLPRDQFTENFICEISSTS